MNTRGLAVLLCICVLLGAGMEQSARGQAADPVRLSLQDAIQKGLQANLGVLVASTNIDEAQAARARAYSAAMLPRISAQTYANAQNRNLRAFGLSIPGLPIPDTVGPFSNYDFRIYAQQNVVDLSSYRQLKASEQAVQTGKLNYKDARDLIVRSVAALYLNAQSAAARVETAQARVNDSTALWKLARDKHDAGSATGVDVLRAEVQLANDKQALLVAQNAEKQALLALARNLGMSPATDIALADPLEFHELRDTEADALIASALGDRADYLALASQRQEIVDRQKANAARWYPKLSLNGNFGGIGRSIGGVEPTGLIQGQLDFTVFDRDRTAEASQLAAQLRQIDDRIADMRRGVEEDVREALLNLQSAADEVGVARQGQELAVRELDLSRDRFNAGTTNNVEVVTAQDELARAEENYIVAVTSHTDAKFALARALGEAEKKIVEFAGKP